MDAEQLKRLAARLRDELSGHGVAIAHGQALDLVAALPGLRNWPEVLAFSDRLAGLDDDLAAMARLARRVTTRLGPRLPESAARLTTADGLMDTLSPWQLTEPRDSSRRERMIIAGGDSSAGAIRCAGIADRVEKISDRLVWGPVPLDADDPVTFHARRLAAWDAAPGTSDQPPAWEREDVVDQPVHPREWSAHLPVIAEYARIELWMDDDANGQLQLIRLLDGFGRQPGLAGRLGVAQVERRLGDTRPFELRASPPRVALATERQIALATRAWNAFRQPTPQDWCALLAQDLDPLPALRRAVLAMLAELPAVDTGLRASERRLLELASEEGATPMRVMARMARSREPGVFGHWEFVRLLNDLGRGPRPVIDGIDDGPFELALHHDASRRQACMRSPLAVSAFGQALLRGEDDLMRHSRGHFWWGGTLVSHDRPWRWDATNQVLSR